MKRAIATAAAVCAFGSMATAAAAAVPPDVTSSLEFTPNSSLYKEVKRSVKLGINARVTPQPGALTVKPLVNAKINFPSSVVFAPHNNVTPVCPLSKIGPTSTNFPSSTAMDLCGSSLVGDGVADLYLAQSTSIFIEDSVILAFNGGTSPQGYPILNLHGYSATLNTGIFMTGTLIKGVLDVSVPRLTADSSVASFQINIPGSGGNDPDYVQAACPSSPWKSSAVFTLAKRDEAGQITEEENLATAETTQKCSGLAGKAKFAGLKVKGPASVRSGSKGAFKVTVKNTGTASSKKGKVTASGGGTGSAGLPVVKPGASRTVKFKVKVTGKKGKKVTVKFKAAGGASATGKIKVKIK